MWSFCVILSLLLLAFLNGSAWAQRHIEEAQASAYPAHEYHSRWGAARISELKRPDSDWTVQFNTVTPITVTSTLEEALGHCVGTYCVIQIDQLHLSDSVYLTRSRTKLVGVPGNRITYEDNVGATGDFIEIESDTQQVLVEGLNIDGRRLDATPHRYGNKSVYGIVLYGENIDRSAILNNRIHHLNSDRDAHGIVAYGTGDTQNTAISNLLIRGNHVYDLRTEYSESVAINGNVERWEISHNRVERINNIAIDAIGGEGTSASRQLDGRILPGLLDAARDGFIEHNRVTDMSTLDNPQYGNQHSWAGAIYIDGAHSLIISHNEVENSEWAYDIGAENCISSQHIVLENNTASGSYYGDLLLGGYARGGYRENPGIECDPQATDDAQEGHGYTEYLTIKNNRLNTRAPVENQGIVNLQFRIRQSIIVQPGVAADHPDGIVTGDQNSIRIRDTEPDARKVLNAVYCAAGLLC